MACCTDDMITVCCGYVHGQHALTCIKINKLKHSPSHTWMVVLLGSLPVASHFHIEAK